MKISNLPQATIITDDDILVIVDNLEAFEKQTKKTTAGTLSNYIIGQIPNSVNTYPNLPTFPSDGSAGKLYIDSNENVIYRWDSTSYNYVAIRSPSDATDAVEQYNSFADLPLPGQSNKIYVVESDNLIYRWNGSGAYAQYVAISSNANLEIITNSTWNANTIAIAYGGTGATDATTARTNLGVIIGTDVQAYSALLGSVAGSTYAGSTSTATVGTITAGTWNGANIVVAYGGTGATDATAARTNLGLGTISTQNSNNVNITGGFLSGVNISYVNLNNSTVGNILISDNVISSTFGDVLVNSYSGKISLGNVSNANASKNIYFLRAYTNDNSETSMTLDGDVPNQNNTLKIKSNKAIWNYDIKVSAYNETTDEGSIFNIRGAAQKKISSASIMPENIQEEWKSSSMENCFVFVDIDNLSGDFYLRIGVTGIDSMNIQWSAIAEISELVLPVGSFYSNEVQII